MGTIWTQFIKNCLLRLGRSALRASLGWQSNSLFLFKCHSLCVFSKIGWVPEVCEMLWGIHRQYWQHRIHLQSSSSPLIKAIIFILDHSFLDKLLLYIIHKPRLFAVFMEPNAPDSCWMCVIVIIETPPHPPIMWQTQCHKPSPHMW